MSRRAVFIDKDGTLLEDVPYNLDPAFVKLTPRALQGLRLLQDAGYALVLVSNQSGVARGYFDEAAVEALMSHVGAVLAADGVELLGCYYCPHHPEGSAEPYAVACECRKPAPGLLLRAAAEHDIDLDTSFLVGDILDDVEAAHRAGCRAVLLDRGSETEWRSGPGREPDFRAADLGEAALWVVIQSLQGATA
ncbi:MAG TPA: HAD family hydrolase [Dehalococcoidia bacterium]|nr:HAD family hydrolase [Dehalococcoidia bacterium]